MRRRVVVARTSGVTCTVQPGHRVLVMPALRAGALPPAVIAGALLVALHARVPRDTCNLPKPAPPRQPHRLPSATRRAKTRAAHPPQPTTTLRAVSARRSFCVHRRDEPRRPWLRRRSGRRSCRRGQAWWRLHEMCPACGLAVHVIEHRHAAGWLCVYDLARPLAPVVAPCLAGGPLHPHCRSVGALGLGPLALVVASSCHQSHRPHRFARLRLARSPVACGPVIRHAVCWRQHLRALDGTAAGV